MLTYLLSSTLLPVVLLLVGEATVTEKTKAPITAEFTAKKKRPGGRIRNKSDTATGAPNATCVLAGLQRSESGWT